MSSGALLLGETVRVVGLDRGLSGALAWWRWRWLFTTRARCCSICDGGRAGGDCLADLAAVRAQPQLFGLGSFRSDRVTAVRDPRCGRGRRGERDAAGPGPSRAVLWSQRRPLGGTLESRADGQVIVDIDATLVTAHSDKQGAEPTFKRGFGFAPMCALSTMASMAAARPDDRSAAWKGLPMEQCRPHRDAGQRACSAPRAERGQVLVRAEPAPVRRCSCTASRARTGVLDRVSSPRHRQSGD